MRYNVLFIRFMKVISSGILFLLQLYMIFNTQNVTKGYPVAINFP